MAKDLLLGIDIGTSGCKIALFSPDGSVMCTVVEDYPVYYPAPGFVEQEPDDWWSAVCRGTKRMMLEHCIDAAEIVGIGVDGQGWAAVAVDRDGSVLTRNPIWLDTRSEAICKELNETVGEDRIFEVSGNPLKAQYTTGKIIWYQRTMPEVYRQIDKVLQSNSFIVYRMTGMMSQDMSQGYGIHCFDMKKGCWNDDMGKALGISRHILPDIVKCHEVVGTVTPYAAESMGLIAGIPVVAGGLDAACGTLGAGVVMPGQTQEQGGQAGGMSICMENYCADPRLILGYHVVPDRWLLQGGTTGGGGVLRWFHEQFGFEEKHKAQETGESSFSLLANLAQTAPAGCEGLTFLPYMAGERSPIWDEKAKGVFYGLDYSKTKAHMVRAAMEGAVYALRHNIEVAAGAGAAVGTMRAMGGAANSYFWTQMKADITGKPIEVPTSDVATTLGAALLAGVGLGLYGSFEDAIAQTVKVKRKHEPSGLHKEGYDRGYGTYLELYTALKSLMHK